MGFGDDFLFILVKPEQKIPLIMPMKESGLSWIASLLLAILGHLWSLFINEIG